eukprot:TRINITY_DN4823_c0_g1_i2.p1 TRINITY_DN4823_c0_g1~~TRINITY_DN4823_c0_g1_i2.p1  ORF type:complete len:127 (-),score=14.84 TRINITY_DN4823_c0_g1_i2:457-813(-)
MENMAYHDKIKPKSKKKKMRKKKDRDMKKLSMGLGDQPIFPNLYFEKNAQGESNGITAIAKATHRAPTTPRARRRNLLQDSSPRRRSTESPIVPFIIEEIPSGRCLLLICVDLVLLYY